MDTGNAQANGMGCDDGDGCTQIDTCQSGVCTGGDPVSCSASDACHMAGACTSTGATTWTCSNPLQPNGYTCGSNMSCTGGVCGCAGNMCGGACVDETSNALHCGACGHNCEGGACSGSKCQPAVLATGAGAYEMALDATNLYWIDTAANTVVKLALSGGSPVNLATGQNVPDGIALDAANVYWTTSGGGSAGTVMKCAIGGCANSPQVLASARSDPTGIAVDANNVYWGEYTSSPIQSLPLAGGTPVPLTTVSNGQPGDVRVDSTAVYWVAPGGGTVNRCSIGGCGASPTTLVSGRSSPQFMGIDGANLYWTENAGIMTCAKAGCGGQATTLAPSGNLAGIFVYGGIVYFSEGSGGTSGIYTCATGGCGMSPSLLIADTAPGAVVVDATHVYWVSQRTVKRLVR